MPIDFQPDVDFQPDFSETIDFHPDATHRVDFQPSDFQPEPSGVRPRTPASLNEIIPLEAYMREGDLDARPRTPGALATDMPEQQFNEIYNKADPFAGQNVPIVPQEPQTEDQPMVSEEAMLKGIKGIVQSVAPEIEGEYVKGAEKSLAKMASGMTTSEGVIGIGLAPFLPSLVGSYFAIKGVSGLKDLAIQSGTDWDSLTKEQRGERLGDMVLSGAIPLAVLLHTGAEAKAGFEKIERAQNISRIRAERAAEAPELPPVLSDAVAKIESDASKVSTGPPGEVPLAEQTKGVESDASKNQEASQVHGDVLDQKGAQESQGQVPFDESRQGIPPNEIVGMGGAVPSEFSPSGAGPTSIRNAQVDVERANRGLPPAVEPARRSFGTVWDEAMGIVDRDPLQQDRLIDELRSNPRALTDTEDALLLQRQIDLQNEYGKATRDLAQAFDDGRMDAVDAERARVADLSDRLFDIYEIGKKVGTETGRGLNARKMMANDDFTLAQMTVEKRAANGGQPLNEEQSAQVKELHDKIAATQKAYDEYVAKTNERLAALEADKAMAEAKSKPEFSPGIIALAEKLATKFENSDLVKSARERLKGRVLSPTPQDIADVATVAASHIVRGGVELAKIAEQVIKEFGEGIRPYIDQIMEQAQSIHDKFIEAESKDSPAVKRALSAKATLEDRVADAVSEIGAQYAKGEKEAIHAQVNRIVRAMVEAEPNISREVLVDRVHEILKLFDPATTRLEAMDAISGRGIFTLPSADEISKTVRDLKQQIRLVGHQEDVIAKKPLPRTGPQRDKMSDAARAEQQKLNELKRQHGVVVTDPKAQLESVLQSRKTYFRNRMADLRKEIANKERTVKTKTPSPTDPELEAMKKEYEQLKKEHNDIFGKRGLTDAQRLKLAEQSAKRSEAEWAKRLENAKEGKYGPTRGKSKQVTNDTIEAIKARIDALKEEVKLIKDQDVNLERERVAKKLDKMLKDREEKVIKEKKTPDEEALDRKALVDEIARQGDIPEEISKKVEQYLKDREEPDLKIKKPVDQLEKERRDITNAIMKAGNADKVALQALKARLKSRTAELLDKLAKGDFSTKKRTPVKMDAEANRLHFENMKAKAAWLEGLFKDRMANRTVPQKLLGGVLESSNFIRALVTSQDLSAVLRQGGFIALGHPVRALKAFPAMFKALRSEAGQHAVNMEIMNRPNFPLYQRSKLYLSMNEVNPRLSQMEEAYMSRWANKVPGVAASQRAYVTFLNKLRADSFDTMMNTLSRDGTFTDLEAKAVANFINVATGRGNMASWEAAATSLNSVFFAPRYALSRFQLLGMPPDRQGLSPGRSPGGRRRNVVLFTRDVFMKNSPMPEKIYVDKGVPAISLIPETLSDGSTAYNLHLQEKVIPLHNETKCREAMALFTKILGEITNNRILHL